jgi:hypothetical protein
MRSPLAGHHWSLRNKRLVRRFVAIETEISDELVEEGFNGIFTVGDARRRLQRHLHVQVV